MFKKLAILSTTAILAASTSVIAAGVEVNADAKQIESLPKSGSVTISGTVKDVIANDKFVLEDSAGKTIDVNTNASNNAKEGETVTVTGNLSSEFLGIGKEINNANVSTAGLDLDSRSGHDISVTGDSDEESSETY